MTRGHRFHLDQDGHSISVQVGRPSDGIEVLVDGKVVAYRKGRPKGAAVLEAELPEEPPRPFRIHVDDMSGEPFCVMETSGSRFLMPQVPLWSSQHEPPAHPKPSPRPLRRLRRILRRL
ncbi:hypothetical protein [Streptomyces sp. NPDC002994]|uniref:hypothetical protein n=1 Tax=Streptomyces sp. NPDC002994 TaxID=3154441 RepID=UPI0033BCF2CC